MEHTSQIIFHFRLILLAIDSKIVVILITRTARVDQYK